MDLCAQETGNRSFISSCYPRRFNSLPFSFFHWFILTNPSLSFCITCITISSLIPEFSRTRFPLLFRICIFVHCRDKYTCSCVAVRHWKPVLICCICRFFAHFSTVTVAFSVRIDVVLFLYFPKTHVLRSHLSLLRVVSHYAAEAVEPQEILRHHGF